jgi:hypothetical protein
MHSNMKVRGFGSRVRIRTLIWTLVLAMAPLPAAAQFPAPPEQIPAPAKPAPKAAPKPVERPKPRPARAGEAQTDPIKCWWKANTTEVRVGQRFTVTLTCGVIETPSTKVIANTQALDPGAVQITPFEVATGVRRDDIVSPPWRYFQYEYQVRLLSEGFFGKDVMLPSLRVTYNIQSSAGGGAEGRDLTYQLPPIPMRVASLVPASATDIRDVSNQGFDIVTTRRFRASTATVVGFVLMGFAAVLLLLAVVRAFGRIRRRQPASLRRLAPASVLAASVRALTAVRGSVGREGWSPALVRRALSLVRLAVAVALGRAIAVTTVAVQTREREGQLAMQDRRRRVMVSAAPTVTTVSRALSDETEVPIRTRPALETLRNAMQVFNTAAYGKSAQLDTLALDRALDASVDAVKQLRPSARVAFAPAAAPSVRGFGSPSVSGDRA